MRNDQKMRYEVLLIVWDFIHYARRKQNVPVDGLGVVRQRAAW